MGGMLAILIVVIILAIMWKYIRPETLQNILKSTKSLPDSDFSAVNLRTVSYFDYRTLKKATANFHQTNLLGKGGFGSVYKGMLDDGTKIAVKQLCIGKSSQGESEFLSEVRLITSIQHRNLVRLVGCCSEGLEKLLVYEFMENGSLDSVVYGKKEIFLSWQSRFQIILGIARGLQYLHEESNLRIIHRDIKASNILLDDKFHPKISDFGLARFFPEDQAYLSTTVAGTLGYTAPEYAIRGELSERLTYTALEFWLLRSLVAGRIQISHCRQICNIFQNMHGNFMRNQSSCIWWIQNCKKMKLLKGKYSKYVKLLFYACRHIQP